MRQEDSNKRPITIPDLISLPRAGSPSISPDGETVVFLVRRADPDENRNCCDLYRVGARGGDPVRLTRGGTSNTDPAWSPDGRNIAFTSNRSGTPQIWMLPVDGGEARQITDMRLGASRPVWMPDGEHLLAISAVYTDTSDPVEIGEREDDRERHGGASPRIADSLMFRHWDGWTEDKLDHLFQFAVPNPGAKPATSGTDLTPGPYPVPPRSLSGPPDYAVAPDGRELCFVSLRDDAQAVSTDVNLWRIPLGANPANAKPDRVSPWEGCCIYPSYSPDGSRIAYCGMRRAGYEADKLELLVFDRASGETREVAPDFERSAGAPNWSPDGRDLLFSAQDRGRTRLYRVAADGGKPEPLTSDATDGGLTVSPDGSWVGFVRQTITSPPEIFRVATDRGATAGGEAEPLTSLSAPALAALAMSDAEDFSYEGAEGAEIHGMLVRPPGFDPTGSYPVVFVIHGGPQGMSGLDFHERWNAQLMAAPGYVVVMLNPRGSTGYGQDFTDAIRGQWGGNCHEDLVRGFDHVLATFAFCDGSRTAAAGASFGGYMVNWIAGQSERFRCLVSHDGMFNTEMMEYATDELWFTEWEFGGTPWENPEAYRQWSPHLHIHKAKTPMLVIQGAKDYRCTESEGLQLFTALQRLGVASRLLYFDDEGHWVLKPRNRRIWWETVHDWFARYLVPTGD